MQATRRILGTLIAISVVVYANTAFAGKGADDQGHCEFTACNGYGAGNNGNGCWCDAACTTYGDCCADYAPACQNNTGCSPNSGQTYILHQGGMCSTQWVYDGDRVANAGVPIQVKAVQTSHDGLAVASATFGRYLDACCTGNNWCYILNYSGGDAVVNHRFANTATDYNVAWVGTSAGAGGGSEVSGGTLADWFGGCDYAVHLGVSEVRGAYNHHDTNGETNWHIGGYDGWWYSSGFLPGEDDGAVSYHSAGAQNTSGGRNGLCDAPQFSGHQIAWTCGGYDLDHYEIKLKFMQNVGW